MENISAKLTRKQGLDKFYTKPDTVKYCFNNFLKRYKWTDFDYIIEPSAGNGNFFHQLPKHSTTIGLDIMPESPDIKKQDFFEYLPAVSAVDKVLIIGNPPFGKICSLAIKFFNHAASFSEVIAFIIPRTFRRTSVQNKLNLNFKLVADYDIPTSPCCFDPPMMVKCCFQIWQKSAIPRNKIILPTIHEDWCFLKFGPKDSKNQPTPPKGADFALRAYGGEIGYIETHDLESLRPKSWHWIKASDRLSKEELIRRFKTLDYSKSKDTARQNSMGKRELIQWYDILYHVTT